MPDDSPTKKKMIRSPRSPGTGVPTNTTQLESRIADLHHELDLRLHTRLSRCFWIIVVGHAIVFSIFYDDRLFDLDSYVGWANFDSPFATLPFGGIGTLAAWFAWTNRTLAQRSTRAMAAIFVVVGTACFVSQKTLLLAWIVEAPCLAVGALAMSLCLVWCQGASFSPPGERTIRSQLSIGRICCATVCMAIWLAGVKFLLDFAAASHERIGAIERRPFDKDFFLNNAWADLCVLTFWGTLLGLIASSIAYAVLQTPIGRLRYFVIGWVGLSGLLIFAFGLKRNYLLNVMGAGVSPLLTFGALKRCGYRVVRREYAQG